MQISWKEEYLKYFQEISNVPRGSGNNKAISNYLVDFAKKHNLWYYQDDAYNVIIRREAEPEYEHIPGIILQGHMDMVCEKESNSTHDFLTEGLELEVDGDYLSAKDTTLGGDDGIALAYGLAILADSKKKYPMIELVATTDEETGMNGAKSLDTDKIKGKNMINLDTEEEGSLLVGCAGGLRGKITLPLLREKKEGMVYDIQIDGLQGGHSGCEINKNRMNATVLLGRLLLELPEEEYSLISMAGGTKDNAIPREAHAKIMIHTSDEEEFARKVDQLMMHYKGELLAGEKGLKYTFSKKKREDLEVLKPESQQKVLFLINNTPNGVLKMSSEMDNLVESSVNMGIFKLDQELEAFYSIRSSKPYYKYYVSRNLSDFSKILGGSYNEGEEYPAWEYREESPLRDKMEEVYERMYGKKPVIEVIHAGLECGILFEKRPDLDIVAIGPDILDIHTPKERLSLSSAKRVFEYLSEVLEELKKD